MNPLQVFVVTVIIKSLSKKQYFAILLIDGFSRACNGPRKAGEGKYCTDEQWHYSTEDILHTLIFSPVGTQCHKAGLS